MPNPIHYFFWFLVTGHTESEVHFRILQPILICVLVPLPIAPRLDPFESGIGGQFHNGRKFCEVVRQEPGIFHPSFLDSRHNIFQNQVLIHLFHFQSQRFEGINKFSVFVFLLQLYRSLDEFLSKLVFVIFKKLSGLEPGRSSVPESTRLDAGFNWPLRFSSFGFLATLPGFFFFFFITFLFRCLPFGFPPGLRFPRLTRRFLRGGRLHSEFFQLLLQLLVFFFLFPHLFLRR